MGERRTTRAEWPLVVGLVAAVLIGWYAVNRWVAEVYPPDLSEGGRFYVVSYATDINPSRNEQVAIFNRYHLRDGTKVALEPAGSGMQGLVTKSAAHNAPDVIDTFLDEDLRTLIDKGIAVPLNPYLKKSKLDLAAVLWPSRLDELRVPNPAWKAGDDPLDQYTYYAFPNNVSTGMVWFNNTLYQEACNELRAKGQPVPREPWINWTWWDYAALAHAMHRRVDGRFISFGGDQPDVENLILQIGLSMRGEDRAAFEALTSEQRHAAGIDGMSWDECIAGFRKTTEGGYEIWPNRTALAQALQFRYDMVNVLAASPSPTDGNQMQTSGGFVGGGPFGQFKAGRLGMLIAGRWFLGQVRGDVAFDWRLLRLPRWVPYAEWARWQAAGAEPKDRDGAWGEREHRLRGSGSYLGGRLAVMTSSARDRDRAFSFLEFLVANRDFNNALLTEDGMGANVQMAREYLSRPDPLFPREAALRTPEHEMGAIERLFKRDKWPYANAGSSRGTIFSNIDSCLNRTDILSDALKKAEAERIDYARLAGSGAASSPEVGRDLAARVVADADKCLADGRIIDRPAAPTFMPRGPTWIAVILAALAAVAALIARFRKPQRA